MKLCKINNAQNILKTHIKLFNNNILIMRNYISMVPLVIYSIYNQILCFLFEYYNKRRVLNQEKLDNISIPKELLHIILNYDGRIKYRNGKYMNTLNDDDEKI